MKKLLKFYLLLFVLLSDFAVLAQPGDNDGSNGIEGTDPAPAPISDKLILLLLVGVLFAVYTFRKNKRTT